jgi:hypothetical protein
MLFKVIMTLWLLSYVPLSLVAFDKAKMSCWYCLWFLLPPLGPIGMLILVSAEWPIYHENSRLKLLVGEFDESHVETVANLAARTEQRGDWEKAAELYELVESKTSDEQTRAYAREFRSRLIDR